MVKLSAELIEQAAQYTNPVRDRELDLRGYKIPVLENLGATLDQFDTVDFSDNEVRKLDGFPLLKRLKTLLMNNNRICRIGENLEQCLPNLRELILTNNSIQELGDLEPLTTVKTLSLLSLLRNPVTNKKHYRLYVINKMPQIRVLDFQKVKLKVSERRGGDRFVRVAIRGGLVLCQEGPDGPSCSQAFGTMATLSLTVCLWSQERQEAEKMFKGKRGAQLAKDIAKQTKTFTPGMAAQLEMKRAGPSQADVEAIKNAIANASSLAEVERLKGMLQAGQIPGRDLRPGAAGMEEEEEEAEGDAPPMDAQVGGASVEMEDMEEEPRVNGS
ncbi:U2 small nuclear ribonucleoprotein A' isoform X1 [Nerophis lumbriciformis]|uniref:U2 small nuclear ribonucleoprotein A' isoform X1 n=1 Tax=Nerophis lumbriciformis TaxID=546530 RepID=UPI003BADA893